MPIQTLYFSNTESTLVPIASMKALNVSYGTAIDTSTSVTNTTAETVQFIPATTGNGTAFTIGTTPDSKGWIFDNNQGLLTGRYWPGTWTIQVYVANSGTFIGGTTGSVSAKLWIVNANGTTVSSTTQNSPSATFTSTAQTLSAANRTYTLTQTINNFLFVYPNQYLYVELYWVESGSALGITTNLWLESPNTFITTPFFEATSTPLQSGFPNRRAANGR
jgi:hypothetical protein